MFTTTVLAGLMNTFVHYISNFLSSMVGQPSGPDREKAALRNPILALVVYIVLQVVLSFLAMIVGAGIRRREFAADAFSAKVWERVDDGRCARHRPMVSHCFSSGQDAWPR